MLPDAGVAIWNAAVRLKERDVAQAEAERRGLESSARRTRSPSAGSRAASRSSTLPPGRCAPRASRARSSASCGRPRGGGSSRWTRQATSSCATRAPLRPLEGARSTSFSRPDLAPGGAWIFQGPSTLRQCRRRRGTHRAERGSRFAPGALRWRRELRRGPRLSPRRRSRSRGYSLRRIASPTSSCIRVSSRIFLSGKSLPAPPLLLERVGPPPSIALASVAKGGDAGSFADRRRLGRRSGGSEADPDRVHRPRRGGRDRAMSRASRPRPARELGRGGRHFVGHARRLRRAPCRRSREHAITIEACNRLGDICSDALSGSRSRGERGGAEVIASGQSSAQWTRAGSCRQSRGRGRR